MTARCRPSGLKVLTLDIETAPGVAYVWGLFKESIPLERLIEPGRMLCWAAKWHGQRRVLFGAEWLSDSFVEDLHDLLDRADVVVTYNGKSFDVPRVNAAMIERGLTPPSPYHQVDLYRVVRSTFKFQSGKLDHVVRTLDLGGKAHTGGFALWRGVMAGDAQSCTVMERYNKEDVRITERLYDALLPWVPNHPNRALYADGDHHVCPRCGSGRLVKRGTKATGVSVFQQYRCSDCGGYSRSGRRLVGADLRPS